MLKPEGVIPQSKMIRNEWITFKWINVSTYLDEEPKYIYNGFREISEAAEVAKQWDIYDKSYSALL
jgi:hypothetical protein